MPYAIEPMSIDDFDEVSRLWQQIEGLGLGQSDSKPNIASYLARNPGLSFVARDANRIIGAVLCGHDGRRGCLHHLAVAREHRKQGLGKALVAACLDRLAGLGILKCNLFLFADNAQGEVFWRHTGWVKRTDLQVMQKTVRKGRGARSRVLRTGGRRLKTVEVARACSHTALKRGPAGAG